MPYADPQKAKEKDREKYLRNKARLLTDPSFRDKYKARQKKAAAKYHLRHRDRLNQNQKRKNPLKYGISEAEFAARIEAQGGKCPVCKEDLSKPCIDHDHKTNQIRGIVCSGCNFGIGHFKDSPERLRAAALYLESEYWKEAK